MRILMLGNSFTFTNDLPALLAERTGAEVVGHTRGGARLSEQLNPETNLGAKTLAALTNQHWDYVVLQEMSNAPLKTKERFLESVSRLCEKARLCGATPVLYATWAYQPQSEKLAESGFSYEEMSRGLALAYAEAAEKNQALLAPVGDAFFQENQKNNLYASDGFHPNLAGSLLAADVLAQTIQKDQTKQQKNAK